MKIEIMAMIPARSGSESIPDKNIKILKGKPLLAYSILQAKESKYIKRVIVSTDSEKYKKIALECGAEAPFLRPKEFAKNDSLDIDTFRHALEWLKSNEGYMPDIIVHLRPTYPLRKTSQIDEAIEKLISFGRADSLRSVEPAKQSPCKMWKLQDDGTVLPLLAKSKNGELYSAPRQSLPQVFWQNAAIDVIRTDTILKKNSMSGDVILGYVMEGLGIDLDDMDDWRRVEEIINREGNAL